jgi:hypothetical protein
MKQAKRVWKASILKEQGGAWVYYIFAICQWLPTNYRLFSKIPNSLPKTLCLLCQSRRVETVDHMLMCPALTSEMDALRSSAQTILASCKFPYAVFPMESTKQKIVQNWRAACSLQVTKKDFPSAQLDLLVWDFFNANKDKQSVGLQQVSRHVHAAIAELDRKPVNLPKDLVKILVLELSLWIEGNTDCLHRNTLFSEWYSLRMEDVHFGSQGSPMAMSMRGCNIYLNLLEASPELIAEMTLRVQDHLSSNLPTRILLIGDAELSAKLPKDPRILPLAEIEHGGLGKLSISLALNKESMVMDPISWNSLTSKISSWCDESDCRVAYSTETDSLFRERRQLLHGARLRASSLTKPDVTPGLFYFFEPRSYMEKSFSKIHPKISARSMDLLNKIANFDAKLLILGILPNQLRTLAKSHDMEHTEDSLELLSEVLFWEGYEVWKKRKLLISNFWRNIAPNDWKMESKDKKEKKGKKGKRKMQPNCKNPFHFCEKQADLSSKRRTICACSDKKDQIQPEKFWDIRYLLTKHAKWTLPKISSVSNKNFASKNVMILGQDDLIRKEHDRGKIKKRKKRKKKRV